MKTAIPLLNLLIATFVITSCAATTLAPTAKGTIENIGPEYGNLETSFSQDDLDHLDIQIGDKFNLTHGATTVTVHLGTTYEDVEKGEWISFLNWEKKLRIARSFANAEKTLEAKAADGLTISKVNQE